MRKHISTRDITKIAIMAALIFVATYLIKIPSLNGYTHIGDSMVIISALILGKKKGALAAGLGAALCDLLSGYMQYIIPTFLICNEPIIIYLRTSVCMIIILHIYFLSIHLFVFFKNFLFILLLTISMVL